MILYYLLNSQGTPRINKSQITYSQSYDKDDILNLTRPCIFQWNMKITNNDHGHAITGQIYMTFRFFKLDLIFSKPKPILPIPVNVFELESHWISYPRKILWQENYQSVCQIHTFFMWEINWPGRVGSGLERRTDPLRIFYTWRLHTT